MLRLILIFFCKSKLEGDDSRVFANIIKAIRKERYKSNRDFIIQCLSYYIDNGFFTESQKAAIERAVNG